MIAFVSSVIAYLIFAAVYVALALFSGDILLPKTVDTGEPAGMTAALLANVGLLLAWGLQHSVMARQSFKDRLTRVVPEHLERSFYVLVSSLALVVLMLGWQPMAGTVWRVAPGPLATGLWVLFGLGWVTTLVASYFIDHFDVFGLKQTFSRWRKSTYQQRGFVAPALYRYVRHPMMTGLLIGFWATPHMTVSHLVLALGMTLYIHVGVHFEERSLLRELGPAYEDYQARTPKFFPGMPRGEADERLPAEG